MLTFELNKDGDSVEVHCDQSGIDELIGYLQKVKATGEHEHLMTQEWAGQELTSEKQGQENKLINKVSIRLW